MNVKKIIKIQALYRAIKARKMFEMLNLQTKVNKQADHHFIFILKISTIINNTPSRL